MQEAFLKLLERWEHVQSLSDPQGYLFKTAFNLIKNRYRRAKRMARRLIRLEPEQEDCFSPIEDRDVVARVLARLSPRQRAAIVLTQLLDLRPEDAGQLMGVTAGTVRSLASQGRSAIRLKMEESHE